MPIQFTPFPCLQATLDSHVGTPVQLIYQTTAIEKALELEENLQLTRLHAYGCKTVSILSHEQSSLPSRGTARLTFEGTKVQYEDETVEAMEWSYIHSKPKPDKHHHISSVLPTWWLW